MHSIRKGPTDYIGIQTTLWSAGVAFQPTDTGLQAYALTATLQQTKGSQNCKNKDLNDDMLM